MILRTRCLLAVFAICLAVGQARGQEGQPGPHVPGAPGAAAANGPDKKYVDLSHSKDRVVKATAERYLNLVKYQEWGGASGKAPVVAKYVSHDPDLKQVKLSVAKGSGKDRVVKEFTVDVDKLNKTCQARVKQIDILQKKLDEMAAAGGATGDGAAGHGGPEGNYAGPGAAPPGPSETPASPGAPPPHAGVPPQVAGPEADPSASEPDPLGFAELPPVTPSAAGAGPAGPGTIPPTGPPPEGAAPVPANAGSSANRQQWRENIAAFAANIGAGTDPTGKPTVEWGELRELREMNEIALAQRGPEGAARSPEAETPAAISERLGDVHWQIVVDKVEPAPGGLVVATFHPVELAKPLELHIALDETDDLQKWAKLTPGSTVPVSARLLITEPYKITAKVKLAGVK